MRLQSLLGLLPAFVCFVPVSGAGSSRGHSGANSRVTFKETKNLCETTRDVQSYAGYVHLPAGTQYASYEQNIFFWFFEARQDPKNAPLTVWLQGGPGMGSTGQALGGNGPCRVLSDSETTEVNEWSWNTHSNMLYIDQPVQAGFSYDTPTPGRVNLTSGELEERGGDGIYIDGTFGSGDTTRTATTTAQAAEAIWDFMQVWMAQTKFNDYRRDNISIWTQSYGGHWAPGIATHFLSKSPSHSERAIGITSIGIINGVVDFLIQGGHSAEFARNNTFGVKAYSQSVADDVTDALEKPGGCRDQAEECQKLAIEMDPENTGTNAEVQAACGSATFFCYQSVFAPYLEEGGLNEFDITQGVDKQFPVPYAQGFLNRESVQKKLRVDISGSKGVNYTYTNPGMIPSYMVSGDYLRKDFRLQLGELLDQGIPVTLVYGDRDYSANWFGGEAISLQIPFDGSGVFADAGYADFVVDGDVAGKTRQAGLLSFTRVFQAGHEVPYYKPKETHALFARALHNKDIPSGLEDASSFCSQGPSSVRDITATPQGNEGNTFCYVMNPPVVGGQCSDEQLAALADGTAVVENFIVVG